MLNLRPLGFTEIIDTAFSHLLKHFKLFSGLCLIYVVCDSLNLLFFSLFVEESADSVLYDIINSLLLSLACGIFIIPVSEIHLGRKLTILGVLQRYKDRFFAYLACSIIYLILNSVYMLLPVISSQFGSPPLLLLFLGILFTIYFIISWLLYGPAFWIENTMSMEALGRSRALVKEKWWYVCGVFLGVLTLNSAILYILSVSFNLILVLCGVSQTGFMEVAIREILIFFSDEGFPISLYDWLMSFFNIVISALATVVYSNVITLLYFNLRIQKEAFDIEARTF